MSTEANLEALDWTNPFVGAAGNCPAFVAAKVGLYPDVYFEFRKIPPRVVERLHKEFREAGAAKDPAQSLAFAQRVVSEQVVSWSLGAFSLERVQMLMHPLLLRIYWIVMHADPTDPIPDRYSKSDADADEKK